MIFRPFLFAPTACASYLFGCLTHDQLAVVDPHVELVDAYLEEARAARRADRRGLRDARAGRSCLRTAGPGRGDGATAYLPAGAGVEFEHVTLADGEVVELGNTIVRALATPGHAPAHNAYVVADSRRGTEEPWLVFTGDSLLVGDVGRPDLHAGGDPEPAARELHGSIAAPARAPRPRTRLSEPLRRLGLRPRPLRQSVLEHRVRAPPQPGACTRGCADFAEALLATSRRAPADQAAIVAGNRRGMVANADMSAPRPGSGLRENAGQFGLLVGLNAFVGAMVGLERSVLPLVGERDFDLASKARSSASSSPSGSPRRSPTSPPAALPTASGASACSSSAG